MQGDEFPGISGVESLLHDGGEGVVKCFVGAARLRNDDSAVPDIFFEFRKFPFRGGEPPVT